MNEPQESCKSGWNRFADFLRDRFNLGEDKAAEEEVCENIDKGGEFRGTNMWVLIFAIFIVSIGLNVDDFDLMKRSLRSLGLAADTTLNAKQF